MYRALALKALRSNVAVDDAAALVGLARKSLIDLLPSGGALLDGQDVTAEIRTQEVGAAASQVSVHPEVRQEMVRRQRELGREGAVVLDGRDIGTAVFPDADVKFYLDADPALRAARRRKELARAGREADLSTIQEEIRVRDHTDSTRRDSPLTRAADALYIDTSGLTLDEVVARMAAAVDALR